MYKTNVWRIVSNDRYLKQAELDNMIDDDFIGQSNCVKNMNKVMEPMFK